MGKFQSASFLVAISVKLASADNSCISAVSWGDPRVDLFGSAPDNSIWHKFYTGYDWQPEKFERIPSTTESCPSVSSWGHGRLDLVWVGQDRGNVLHKYFDGGGWGPSWEESIDLGGHVKSAGTYSWGIGRLDIVGNHDDGSYVHKAWTGTDYFPAGQEWESLGGNFSSLPAVGSWGEGRLDVVGISAENASLMHRYWAGDSWSNWEDLRGGPFIGNPRVSSWGSGRLDLWAVDQQGELNHKFWDGYQWNGWERLGGEFWQAPQVVHWAKERIDIVGRNRADDKYYLKSFDGHNWNPSHSGWYDLSGPYGSEPSLITKLEGQNFLYLFGVDVDNSARMQIWSGYEWQPSAEKTWPLGNVSEPYPSEKSQDSLTGNEL